MLLGTLRASLLGNVLAGKGVIAKSISEETKSKRQGWQINRAGEGTVRAGYGSNSWSKKNKFSFPSSSVDEYWNKKVLSKWTYLYSGDNLPNEIKDGAYVINLDDYSDIGTRWIALSVQNNYVTYFDSFGV